jgi:hypothetical protein
VTIKMALTASAVPMTTSSSGSGATRGTGDGCTSAASFAGYLDDINAGQERPRWRFLQARTATAGAGGGTATIGSNWNGGQ